MQMLRRAWKPVIGTAVLVGAPSYVFYRWYYARPSQESFDLQVRERGPDGKPAMLTRTFPLISKDQADARLAAHAAFSSATRPDGIVWKHATAFLASNDPIEDANDSAIMQRDAADPSAPGDLLFFAVMDGHAGPHTSRLLSKVLIPAVTLELSSRLKAPPQPTFGQSLKSILRPTASSSLPVDADPEHVTLALQTAFLNLDAELTNAPLQLLAANLDKIAKETRAIPDLSQHPMAMASMLPAMSGSCALLAMIDTAHSSLYVACTGDSRAVAGVYEESEDGQGVWRVEVLSEDQTGRNPNELKRLRSEHPPSEADVVIRNGRILGGLEPSRAFGDARYKWPREVQEVLSKAFFEGTDQPMRATPSLLKTPPYVTARPEVTHRKLSLPSASSAADADVKPKSTLRFLVLATDGLWDELSSEDVVALVGGHLAGLRGRVPKSALPALVRTTGGAPTVSGKDRAPRRSAPSDGAWAFEDENVGTHLIRNAFGGADERRLRRLLSIPAPHARSYRDDVTVSVVWWEEGREGDAQAAAVAAGGTVKAKL
ncbi:protein serine/threonine phosphatase 2C [Sparassis latifolia]